MRQLDRKWTKKLSDLSGSSPLLDRLGVFGARYLLWVMAAVMVLVFFSQTNMIWLAALTPLCAWVVAISLEYIIKRPRPFVQSKKEPLGHPMWNTPSFPSGHATISFAIATLTLFVTIGVGTVLLVFAAIVAVSRVFLGVHFFTDIIAGAFIGSLLSVLFALIFLL